MRRRSLLASLALASVLAGCPGSLDDPGRFAGQLGVSCPDVPALFVTTCTSVGCHAAASSAAGLDLASAGVFTRLSGKPAAGGSGLLADPADPAASVVYTKLGAPPPFGSRMPLSGTPLGDDEIACVLAWIETSAKSPP